MPATAFRLHWLWPSEPNRAEDSRAYRRMVSTVSSAIERDGSALGSYTFSRFADPLAGPARVDEFTGEAPGGPPEELTYSRVIPIERTHQVGDDLEEILQSDLTRPQVREAVSDLLEGPLTIARNDGAGRLLLTVYQTTLAKTGVHPQPDQSADEHDHREHPKTLSNDAGDSSYSGPLYAYAIDHRQNVDDGVVVYLERTSPINVGFRDPFPGGADAATAIRSAGWGPSVHGSGDRWVIQGNLDDPRAGTISRQDDEVYDRKWDPRGYHLRLWEVNDMDTGRSDIGQVHYDPFHHGVIPMIGVNWRLAESRRVCGFTFFNHHPRYAFGTTHLENVYRDLTDPAVRFESAGGNYTQVPSGRLQPSRHV